MVTAQQVGFTQFYSTRVIEINDKNVNEVILCFTFTIKARHNIKWLENFHSKIHKSCELWEALLNTGTETSNNHSDG
jgi:hypothetical protein